MKKKIFVTGSTSYLGTKFVDLYGAEFEIFGVAQHDPDNPLDLLDFEALKAAYIQFKPDVILHLAADVGRDTTTSNDIIQTNPGIVQNLINLALPDQTPFIFTSSEAVYGGKWTEGDYTETDEYQPRSPYGASKVASEKLLIGSGWPYLITRGHRHVGISPRFNKVKWFLRTRLRI
jgi:nucleoside-diphosphate-sugar epimerase